MPVDYNRSGHCFTDIFYVGTTARCWAIRYLNPHSIRAVNLNITLLVRAVRKKTSSNRPVAPTTRSNQIGIPLARYLGKGVLHMARVTPLPTGDGKDTFT